MSLADFTDGRWVMEEKYDGHRLLVIVKDTEVNAWSRPGHDRPAAERALPGHIVLAMSNLPNGTYDGELYIEGGTSSDVVRLDLQDKLRLVLFDVLECQGENIMAHPFKDRSKVLGLVLGFNNVSAAVHIASQYHVEESTVKRIWSLGGEGVILKRLDSEYRSGWRTPDWIKIKKIEAAEFTIIGFDEGKNGPCSVFKLRHDDGRETSCKVLTNELLALVHKNPQKYIGRRVTVSHMGFTKSGLWRHPVFDHFNQE
jgi:bifunctional non-homologous end joining protein LigD